MKKRADVKWMIWLPFALFLIFGCGAKGKEIKKIEGEAETSYREALARFNKRDYFDALKKFETIFDVKVILSTRPFQGSSQSSILEL